MSEIGGKADISVAFDFRETSVGTTGRQMRAAAVICIPLLAACSGTIAPQTRSASTPMVIDGHSDFAVHYLKQGWAVQAHDIATSLPGQSDVPRWRKGGINGALVTVGSDLPPGSAGHFPRVLESVAWFNTLIDRHPDVLVVAHSADDFERAQALGKIALMPAIEGGDQIDGKLENLRAVFAAGVRSMGIVYDHHNAIGDGAMAIPNSSQVAARASNGLTPLGREVILEMNRLGMIIDLSHAAETTALEVMHLSAAPVIFSHSGARALANTSRNLSDATLHMVHETGGLVMVPLVPYLTTSEHWEWWTAGEAKYAELATQHGDNEPAIKQGMSEWDAANPPPLVTVQDVADQIEYVAGVVGKDNVGIGTDFDGMGSFAIPQLADASTLPQLLEELVRRGWREDDLHKLARGNFLRVLSEVEAAAEP